VRACKLREQRHDSKGLWPLSAQLTPPASAQHRDQLQAALNAVARATSTARARAAACQLHLVVGPHAVDET
jgi:hypothetical protein